MPDYIGIGIGTGLDSAAAARNAVYQAVDQIGNARPTLVLTIISHEYDIERSVRTITGYLPNVPIWGYSAVGTFTSYEINSRCMFVIILADDEISSKVSWWPQYADKPDIAATELHQILEKATVLPSGMLIAADGINGDIILVQDTLNEVKSHVIGVLSGGEPALKKTWQIANGQCATDALSVLSLNGKITFGTGVANGWFKSGVELHINKVEGNCIRLINDSKPARIYADLFKNSPEHWCKSPLMYLARLYPLGVERAGLNGQAITLHAPLFIEQDGSFQMNIPPGENRRAHLMIGIPESCKQEVKTAAEEALSQLGNSVPVLCIVNADIAWQMLFGNDITPILQVLQSILGDRIPLIGAFTLGQVARTSPSAPCIASNQELVVTLIGKPTN